ncbi:hypothetical protein AB1M95_13805 [Sulfitobacter sp. LCG007]
METFDFVVVAAMIAAGTAVASKPRFETFPPVLSASLDGAFRTSNTFQNSGLTTALKGARCSIQSDGCEKTIRDGMAFTLEDWTGANVASVTFDGNDIGTCFGLVPDSVDLGQVHGCLRAGGKYDDHLFRDLTPRGMRCLSVPNHDLSSAPQQDPLAAGSPRIDGQRIKYPRKTGPSAAKNAS